MCRQAGNNNPPKRDRMGVNHNLELSHGISHEVHHIMCYG